MIVSSRCRFSRGRFFERRSRFVSGMRRNGRRSKNTFDHVFQLYAMRSRFQLILPTKRSSICLHKCEMQLANYTYYISWTRILRRGMCRFHLLCLRNVASSSFVLRNVSLSSVASWDVSVPVHVSHISSSLRTSRGDETVQFGCNAGTCTGCPRNVLVYLYFCLPIELTFSLHSYSHTYKQIRNVLVLSRNDTQIVCLVLW